MKPSRRWRGKLVLSVVGVLVCGENVMLSARTFRLDVILSHFTVWDTHRQNQQRTHSYGGTNEQLYLIKHITNISHPPALPSNPLGIGIPPSKNDSSAGIIFSQCPANDSQSYNQSLLPQLHFVHIRKTGGTAVVTSFRQAGLDPYKTSSSIGLNITALRKTRRPGNRRHVPPRYWKGLENIKNIHLFAIVRNPYDRAISEYYQHFKSGHHRLPPNVTVNDAAFMNHFIQSHFRHGSQDLFFPQYHYVFDTQGNQIVHHILRFESLLDEFPQLMACYGLDEISLPNMPVNKRQTGAGLSVANLTAESIALINEVERVSFQVFGYEMLLPSNSTFSSTITGGIL